MHKIKIFGPPGTGKTQTLLRFIEEYQKQQNCPPDNIGLVAFTRAGREEALARLGGGEDRWPLVRTIHSLCYRGLGMSSGRMVSKADLQKFAEIVGVEISGDGQNLDDETAPQELPVGDQLLRLNHLGRHRRLKLREALAALNMNVDEALASHFTTTYRRWKDNEGILDYTDLLTRYLERGMPFAADLFIVDEAQDLSPLQWEVFAKMSQRAKIVMAAGDDDQAIYSWAGATADLFNNWQADEVQVLHQSYRLPRTVHEKVQEIGAKIESRTAKEYAPRDETGVCAYTTSLYGFNPEPGSTLVLYRYGHRGKQLAKELRENGVCFTGLFSPITKYRLALEYINGKHDKDCLQAAQSLSSVPDPKVVSDLSRAWYLDYLVRVASEVGLKEMLNPRVTLSSIHQSKGRQADMVVLDNAMSRASYEHLLAEPDDEHRVWYVGASRAKKHLVILESGAGRYQYDL